MESKIITVFSLIILCTTFPFGFSFTLPEGNKTECICDGDDVRFTLPVPDSCDSYYQCSGKDQVEIKKCPQGQFRIMSAVQKCVNINNKSYEEACKQTKEYNAGLSVVVSHQKRFQSCKIKETLQNNENNETGSVSYSNSELKQNIEETTTTPPPVPVECNVTKLVVHHYPGPCRAEISCENGSSFIINKCLNTLTFISQYNP